ncbi:MAG: tetratricopeptide repeat protein, partial [Deltaproteobacteria bacterium]|nr:tetratricopeptide repeat protein [Deltaproteobacteria bacterium]
AGRSAEHEPFLRSLVESDPDDPGARLALARTLAADAQPDEAVAEIRRLLERGPDNLEAYGTLGRVLLAEHRDPEAIKTFAELLEVLERGGLLRPRESSR